MPEIITVSPNTIDILAREVPSLLIVALLVWSVFRMLVQRLDRMADSVDAVTKALMENTLSMRGNTASMNRVDHEGGN